MWDGGAPLLSPAGGSYADGTTLVAGHVNYVGQGDGALFNLYRVQPGAVVYATDAWGRTTLWRVVSAESVLKQDLPASVFAGNQGPRRLVIVTCGGDIRYVPGSGWTYDDNVVVTAVPAPIAESLRVRVGTPGLTQRAGRKGQCVDHPGSVPVVRGRGDLPRAQRRHRRYHPP